MRDFSSISETIINDGLFSEIRGRIHMEINGLNLKDSEDIIFS